MEEAFEKKQQENKEKQKVIEELGRQQEKLDAESKAEIKKLSGKEDTFSNTGCVPWIEVLVYRIEKRLQSLHFISNYQRNLWYREAKYYRKMGITFDSVSQSLKEALITPEHMQVTIRTVRKEWFS